MKSESVASILNPQTVNLMSSGGGGFESIIAGDLYGVFTACEADPLTWAYLFSYYDIGLSYDRFIPQENGDYTRVHVSNSLNEFSRMLEDWVFKNYLEWLREDDMIKALEKATTASDEISEGLALYLSKKPKEEIRIAQYFRPVNRETFRRKYKKFAIKASRHFFQKLVNLSNQIDEYTKNRQ